MESLSLMTNINHVEKNIIHYKNLIEDPSAFIKMIEDTEFILDRDPQIHKWNDWYSSDGDGSKPVRLFGKNKNARFVDPQSDTTNGLKAHLVTKKIKDVVTQCALDYQDRTNIKIGFLPDHFSIKKYDELAYMGPHVDYEGEGKTDFYPTILNQLGIKIPKKHKIDGVDISTAFKGETQDRGPIITYFPDQPKE